MKFSQLTLLISFMAMATACSTKIDTIAPYKDITVVYAKLDIGDTAHYVRIQKAFLSQTQSQYNIAKIPDSSFYLNLDVSIKEIDPSSEAVHNTIVLNKVNMADEGYSKDTGVFFTDPHYAYKFKYTLSSRYWYRLIIRHPQTGEVDSAQTPILSEDSLSDHGFRVPFFARPYQIIMGQTANVNPYVDFSIDGYVPDSTKFMDGICRLRWVDRDTTTGIETDRFYDWYFNHLILDAPAYIDHAGFSLFIQNLDFVNAYQRAMGPAPLNTVRFLDSLDMFFYAGTNTLYKYQLAYGDEGVGILASDAHPIFSNIAGANIYGIFTSVARRCHYNITFQKFGFDYIVYNPILDSMHIEHAWADR